MNRRPKPSVDREEERDCDCEANREEEQEEDNRGNGYGYGYGRNRHKQCHAPSRSGNYRYQMPKHKAGSSFGYKKKHSTKTSTRASGMVVTKGKGQAMISANDSGVKSAAAAEEGSYLQSNFGKKEDSWADASGYHNDGCGNTTNFRQRGAKKQKTLAKSRAAAKGRGMIISDVSEEGVNVAARGEKGTMANSGFDQQEDSWSVTHANNRRADGSRVHYKDKRGTKRSSRSQSNAMGLGAGAAAVHSGKRGTKAKVKGTRGAKVHSKHDIQDDSWNDTQVRYKNRDGSHGGYNDKSSKRQDSKACVDSEAYGDADIEAQTDRDSGVNIKAKGKHGTKSRFGWSNDVDGWGDTNAWGVGARKLEERALENDNTSDLEDRIEELEDLVLALQEQNADLRRRLERYE